MTATAPDGTQGNATVQVTSTGPSPTRVSATALQGFASLEVAFNVVSDRPIQAIEGNYAVGYQVCEEEGEVYCYEPGSFYVSAGEPLEFYYDDPGVYEARFNVIHTDGTSVTKTLYVVAESVDQVDEQLRQIWGGMASALVRGDKAGAMQYLNVQAREKYGPVFDALLPDMGQILGSFSDLQTMTVDSAVGEYAINRTIDGVNRIFLIYFLRDGDGVWRVDSM